VRSSRRNFGAFSRLRDLPGTLCSDRIWRPLALPALAFPVVVQTAAEESIEAVAAATQFANIPSIVASSPEVVKTFSEIASTHVITVRMLMHSLDMLHTAGLPWVAAIVAMTVGLRICLIPLLIYSSKVAVRIACMRPDVEEMNAEFARRKALNMDARENSAEQARNTVALYQKHGLSPFSPFVMPMVSGPLFISCFFALTALSTEGVAGMKTEGAFWFPDLTAMDPYYVLPLLSSWTGVLILKRGSESGGVIDPKIAPMIKFISVLGLLAPLVTYQLPSGVLVYFSAMSIFSVFQGEIIRADATRRMLGMPTLSEMRIKTKVPGYTPFKADEEVGLTQSLNPKQGDHKKTEDGGGKIRTARKKPLPLPFKKR